MNEEKEMGYDKVIRFFTWAFALKFFLVIGSVCSLIFMGNWRVFAIIVAVVAILSSLAAFVLLKLLRSSRQVSNRKALEIMTEQQRSEELARAKDEFLANMSHEIRTPLSAIQGFSEQLRHTELDKLQKEYLRAIRRSSEHLLSTVDDILDFTKMSAGKLNMESIPFEIESAISEVVATLKLQARMKGNRLVYKMKDCVIGPVFGDPFRLKQVLFNLVGNAIKFTDSGTIFIRCEVLEESETEISLKLGVHDTGKGISPDMLQQMFEDFSQEDASTSRRYGGTGLGLSISRKLVELQGGKLTATSVKGKGSVFNVELDFVKVSSEIALEMEAEEIFDPQPLVGKTVLLVDDDVYSRRLTKIILKRWDVRTIVAENGVRAKEMVDKMAFDLILTDVQMPEVSGIDLARHVRNGSMQPAVPIIAVTANVMKGQIESIKEAGIDDYLGKPFTENAFVSKLSRLLREVPTQRLGKGILADGLVNEATISLAQIKSFIGDDTEALGELLEVFLESNRENIRALQQLDPANQQVEIGNLAHKMLPSFQSLSLANATEHLKWLEALAYDSQDVVLVESRVQQLLVAAQFAEQSVRAELLKIA